MSIRTGRRVLSSVLFAYALLPPATVEAAKPPRAPLPEIAQIAPAETLETEVRGNARVRTDTGQPVTLRQVDYAVTPGAPEAMALEYLAAHADALHLVDPGLGDLHHRGTWSHPAGHTVRFRQMVGAVPVHGPDLAVTINHDAVVRYVASGYRPEAARAALDASIEAETAEVAALAALGSPTELAFLETELVVYPGSPSRLAWRTRVAPRVAPIGDWEILTDARSGEIFKLVDRAPSSRVDGNGNVFLPDPLSSSGADYGDPGFTDGSDADTPQLDSQLFNSLLPGLTQDGPDYLLIGPFAEIVDDESPFKGLFAQPSSSFEFARQNDAFEAVNAYYHIDKIMHHFNVILACRSSRSSTRAAHGSIPTVSAVRTTPTTSRAPASWPSARAESTTPRTPTSSCTSSATPSTTGSRSVGYPRRKD